jgi:hypothetical protein
MIVFMLVQESRKARQRETETKRERDKKIKALAGLNFPLMGNGINGRWLGKPMRDLLGKNIPVSF